MAYTNQYEAEAPAKIAGKEPPNQWPQRGVIKVEGLVLRYRPELDPVLKGLTFTVNAREKVTSLPFLSLIHPSYLPFVSLHVAIHFCPRSLSSLS